LSAINGILVFIIRNSAVSLLRIIVVPEQDPCRVRQVSRSRSVLTD
jgi:hypothetical protein